MILNFAGALGVPLVVLVANNQYAISVPFARQTAAATCAQKGIAAGIDSEQVDGNDIFAVHYAVYRALCRASAEYRPSLIEALTYRLGAHTTADDPTKYRDEQEVAVARKLDPIRRMRRLIENMGIWDDAKERACEAWAGELIEAAVERYEYYVLREPHTLTDVYDNQVAELHYTLSRERALSRAYAGALSGEGGGHG